MTYFFIIIAFFPAIFILLDMWFFKLKFYDNDDRWEYFLIAFVIGFLVSANIMGIKYKPTKDCVNNVNKINE